MSVYPAGDPESKPTTRVLRRELGDALLEAEDHRGDLCLRVAPERLSDALTLLKQDPELDYKLLLDVCGVDMLGREPRFDVVYHLKSLTRGHRVRLKVAVAEGASVPSAIGIWKAADWFEREAYDLLGIRFDGHPFLRRILCHDEFVGHALRKDYPQTLRHSCTQVSDLELEEAKS